MRLGYGGPLNQDRSLQSGRHSPTWALHARPVSHFGLLPPPYSTDGVVNSIGCSDFLQRPISSQSRFQQPTTRRLAPSLHTSTASMAYSPTPQSASLPSAGHAGSSNPFYRLERHSPSPPPQQTAINKRDRRRIAIQDRLAEISLNFAENRDANYRKQLQQYQADINFINNAQLYDNKPLLEPGEDDGDTAVNGAAGMRQQPPGLVNGNARHEPQSKTGRYAARFVHEVNDAMEQRDVNLTANVVCLSTQQLPTNCLEYLGARADIPNSTISTFPSSNMRRTTNSLSKWPRKNTNVY